jgi:ribose/xylose/arabinose/galactoside ABC-type transport system permease subunit
MVMMGINIYWFNTVLGLFLIAVVFINTLSASSMERRKIKEMKQEFNA